MLVLCSTRNAPRVVSMRYHHNLPPEAKVQPSSAPLHPREDAMQLHDMTGGGWEDI